MVKFLTKFVIKTLDLELEKGPDPYPQLEIMLDADSQPAEAEPAWQAEAEVWSEGGEE